MGTFFQNGDRVIASLKGPLSGDNNEVKVKGFVAAEQGMERHRIAVMFVGTQGRVELVRVGLAYEGSCGAIVLEVSQLDLEHDALHDGETICMSDALEGPTAEVIGCHFKCAVDESLSMYYVKVAEGHCIIAKKRSDLCVA